MPAPTQTLTFEELRDLLTGSIHGVDLSEEAVHVAAFSCYLALLDFLEPKSIWEEVRFPKLVGTNLFVNDFFIHGCSVSTKLRYDIIVGNPPWRSNLTAKAANYVRENDLTIGDKQIAQAFLWRAPTLLAEEGRICLLAPSKGVLFNDRRPKPRLPTTILPGSTVISDKSSTSRHSDTRSFASSCPNGSRFYGAASSFP